MHVLSLIVLPRFFGSRVFVLKDRFPGTVEHVCPKIVGSTLCFFQEVMQSIFLYLRRMSHFHWVEKEADFLHSVWCI